MSRNERGSASVEAVIIVPAIGLFIALLIFAGRVTLAHQTVNAAAAEAARTATIARTPTDADTRARQAAQAMLTEQNTVCAGTEISIDTSGFARPIGTPAQVTVTVTCHTQLADLTLPGVGGTLTITSTASSPLDPFRGR